MEIKEEDADFIAEQTRMLMRRPGYDGFDGDQDSCSFCNRYVNIHTNTIAPDIQHRKDCEGFRILAILGEPTIGFVREE